VGGCQYYDSDIDYTGIGSPMHHSMGDIIAMAQRERDREKGHL
jgi:hypothetical protein